MPINYFVFRRHTSFWIGLGKTVPFISAGILSFIFFYSQDGVSPNWDRDAFLVSIFALLSTTVFIAVSQQLPYSTKNVIEDLLAAMRYQLGNHYRINLMMLVTSDSGAYFKMTHGVGYDDAPELNKQLTMAIPGASQAWEKGGPFYFPKSKLATNIDPTVKHLWSVAVRGRRGISVAVLNVDNIEDDHISDDIKNHIIGSSNKLAELISFYWEIPG